MQITDFLEFSLPTFGISIATATWLAKQLVDHGLKPDLQRQKSELVARLAVEKTHIDANVRQQVDTLLADRAADREYALEARKLFYQSIGPLRFQLLLACRDLAGRIIAHSRNPYDTGLASYYGKSFLYRLLRPLALSELIER
jgi:hypothetical protein